MADRLHLAPQHRRILVDLLREHLPEAEAWAYGSRVNGRSHEGSDLDLALRGPGLEELPWERLLEFEAAIRESAIPILVEAMDWARLPERFQREIEREYVAVVSDGGSKQLTRLGKCKRRAAVFAELLDGKVRNGIYKRKEHRGYGIKIVNMGELFAHPRLGAVPMKRVDLSVSETERFSVIRGDLLFARRSLVAEGAGKCCVVLEVDEPTTFESSIIRARPNAKTADPLYLYYYFCSPSGFHQLDTIRRHGVVAGITGKDLSGLEIPMLPLPEQRAIAHVLGALDDKIELNRRMNETLEGMARALFKSWFVDFDPVRAKMEGRDTGLPQDVADLFPDRMVDSEMGRIPEGWEPVLLGDIVDMQGRGMDPGGVGSDTPYIGLADMPRGSITLARWGYARSVTSRKFAFKAGQILFGKLRPYFHKVGIAPVDGLCSTDIVVLDAQDPKWRAFAMMCVSSSAFVAYASKTATGTKMPRTNWQTMTQYEVSRPTEAVAAAFQKAVSPMLQSVVGNIHESRTLAALRDTLLPKLVSGELRVPDAEALLESAL